MTRSKKVIALTLTALAIAGAATAFINGGTPDHTTPNNSVIVEVSPGAEISTIGYPYSGGALAAGSDHTGGNQDAIVVTRFVVTPRTAGQRIARIEKPWPSPTIAG